MDFITGISTSPPQQPHLATVLPDLLPARLGKAPLRAIDCIHRNPLQPPHPGDPPVQPPEPEKPPAQPPPGDPTRPQPPPAEPPKWEPNIPPAAATRFESSHEQPRDTRT